MERKLPFQWQHNEFREAFGAFLDKEAVPYYDEWCANHQVPHEYFEKMGQAGYERARDVFSWESIGDKTVEVYQSVLDEQKK